MKNNINTANPTKNEVSFLQKIGGFLLSSLCVLCFSSYTYGAGVNDGVNLINSWTNNIYLLLIAGCSMYAVYLVIMALLDKKGWNEVVSGLIKVAFAVSALVIVKIVIEQFKSN